MNNVTAMRQRRHPRPLIRTASVFDGRQRVGRLEVDDHGRVSAIGLDERCHGVYDTLAAAVRSFGEGGEDTQ